MLSISDFKKCCCEHHRGYCICFGFHPVQCEAQHYLQQNPEVIHQEGKHNLIFVVQDDDGSLTFLESSIEIDPLMLPVVEGEVGFVPVSGSSDETSDKEGSVTAIALVAGISALATQSVQVFHHSPYPHPSL